MSTPTTAAQKIYKIMISLRQKHADVMTTSAHKSAFLLMPNNDFRTMCNDGCLVSDYGRHAALHAFVIYGHTSVKLIELFEMVEEAEDRRGIFHMTNDKLDLYDRLLAASNLKADEKGNLSYIVEPEED